MTYNANTTARIDGPGLRKPGVARQLAAGSSSANTALTTTCERISIHCVSQACRYAIGTGAQTANASTSHFIKNGERIELDVPQHIEYSAGSTYGNLLASNIAVIRDGSTDGVLELTEFVN
jgi:hypothetical protein